MEPQHSSAAYSVSPGEENDCITVYFFYFIFFYHRDESGLINCFREVHVKIYLQLSLSGGGWMETWKDRAALMWSMWNPQLNPNNPGVNPTWIRSNRLRHERTAHPSWAKRSCNINRRMFSYHIEPLSLFSHQSPWSHGQQVSLWKTGWGQQVNMGLWFTWEIPEAEREQRSVTSWL